MTRNMGTGDRALRIAAASTIALLYFTGFVGGTVALVLWAVAAVLLITALVGTCPLYIPLRISTTRHDRNRPAAAH